MHPDIRPLDQGPHPLEQPLLLAAFSGASGNSAASTVAYLAQQWEARPVADIDPDGYYDFSVLRPIARLHEGVRSIEWPDSRFFVARPQGLDRDVVLFVGAEPHYRWRGYAEAFADVLRTLGVRDVVLVSAFGGAVPHTRPAPVQLIGADEATAERFGMPTHPPRYQGPATFSMALGVMLREQAAEAGWSVATLNAIAPFYVGVDPSPYAVDALVSAIDRALGVATPREEIVERTREVNEHAAQAMARSERLRVFVHNLEQQYDESAGDVAAAPGPSESLEGLSAQDLVSDVEAFLRGQRDEQGDAPGRGAGSEGGQRPVQ